MNTADLYAPLSRIPVLMTCGHYELRVTRFTYQSDRDIGYLSAGSPCTQCSAYGRPVQPCYADLEAAQDEAKANPFRSNKGAQS